MSRFLSNISAPAHENNRIVQSIKQSEFIKLMATLNGSDSSKIYRTLQVLASLAPNLSAEQTETVTNLVFEKFKNDWNSQNRAMWKGGLKLLGMMAPRLDKESIKQTYEEILEKLEKEPLFFRDCRDVIATTISQIVHVLSEDEISTLYFDLLALMKRKPEDSYVVVSPIIVAIISKLTLLQIQAILDLIEPKIYENDDSYIYLTAKEAYANILAETIIINLENYQNAAEFRTALIPISAKLENEHPMARKTALQALQAIGKKTSNASQLDIILEKIKPLLEDKNVNVQYQALLALEEMIFNLNPRQVLQLVTPLLTLIQQKYRYIEDDLAVRVATIINKMTKITKLPRLSDNMLEIIRAHILNSKYDFVPMDPNSFKCLNLLAPLFEPDQLATFIQPLINQLARLEYVYPEGALGIYSDAVSALTRNETDAIFDANVRNHLADQHSRSWIVAENVVEVLAPQLSEEQALYYFQYLLSDDFQDYYQYILIYNWSIETLQKIAAKLPQEIINNIASELLSKLEGNPDVITFDKCKDLFLGILPQLTPKQISAAFNLLLPKLIDPYSERSHAMRLLIAMVPNLTHAQIGEAITVLYNNMPLSKLEDTFIRACLDAKKCTIDQLVKANVHNDPERILLICQASSTLNANKLTRLNKNSFFMSQIQSVNTASQMIQQQLGNRS